MIYVMHNNTIEWSKWRVTLLRLLLVVAENGRISSESSNSRLSIYGNTRYRRVKANKTIAVMCGFSFVPLRSSVPLLLLKHLLPGRV